MTWPGRKKVWRELGTLAVRAAGPAAWSAHRFAHFVQSDGNAACPRFRLCTGLDPANPFIAGQRRNIQPHALHCGIRRYGLAEILRQPMMDRATGKCFVCHGRLQLSRHAVLRAGASLTAGLSMPLQPKSRGFPPRGCIHLAKLFSQQALVHYMMPS